MIRERKTRQSSPTSRHRNRAPTERQRDVTPNPAELQRRLGNRGTQAWINMQAKLTVAQPGDRYEREADVVAEQVIRAKRVSQISRFTAGVQSRSELARQPAGEGPIVTPNLETAIQSRRGGGQALPAQVREPMEQSFESDFSHTRIHTDAESDRLNQSLSAQAFTIGQDVFFRQGSYSPATRRGQELLAHELTHTIQQSSPSSRSSSRQSLDRDGLLAQQTEGTITSQGKHAKITTNQTGVIAREVDQDALYDIVEVEGRVGAISNERRAIHILNSISSISDLVDTLEELKAVAYDVFLWVSESGPPESAPGFRLQLVRAVEDWTGADLDQIRGNISRLSVDDQAGLLRYVEQVQGELGEGFRAFPASAFGQVQYQELELRAHEEADAIRQEAMEQRRRAGEENPVIPEVDVDPEDLITEAVERRRFQTRPIDRWYDLVPFEQEQWRRHAQEAWQIVRESLSGTSLERLVEGKDFEFDPVTALENGWYAWVSGNTLHVGMSWVRYAHPDLGGDPRNVWENIAHELGGHIEYGRTFASEIMQNVLSRLSAEERRRLQADSQDLFEAFAYSETEIFSALRQRRYRMPPGETERPSGGIHPDRNIDDHLGRLNRWFEPIVLEAIVRELYSRINESREILDRDKQYFVDRVRTICNTELL